ncbi:Protein of unknown function DUF820 [Crocosphaera watsonii WH 0402]|uniref:Uncharacterized protein n=1 Tax=Crocosphaera watsonii WH 0402 TaxID=1284629 RepID=T2JSZ2_CROWT|nr:Protein of unknown function DUF820 [Crocosphaera watsonii WH 0402]
MRLFEGIYQLIDRDVLPWLKSKEKSFESYINTLLRASIQALNKVLILKNN